MALTVNVRELADDAQLRPIHFQVLAICFITAIIDGLDHQIIGFSAHSISKDLDIPLSNFGVVFSAGIVGTLIGAVVFGRVADIIGRRKSLIICSSIFTVFTLFTPIVANEQQLSLLRLVAGLGLGGAMPSFLTLVSEYSPKNRKAIATSLLWIGYPLGGVVGGLVGAQLIPQFGWHSVFYFGGVAGVLVVVAQLIFLPESLQFLAMKGGKDSQIQKIAQRLKTGADFSDARFTTDAHSKTRASVSEVFADGRALPTVLLWAPLFLTFMLSKFTVLWAPALFESAGMTVATAATILALGNAATLPSMAATGYFLDRFGPSIILPVSFFLVAVSMVVLAISLATPLIVGVAMIAMGALNGPGIAGMIYLSTSIYPSKVRSTGIGIAMGVGRSGQVVVAMLIGWLVALGLSPKEVFLGMCLAPLFAMGFVILLNISLRNLRSGRASSSPDDSTSPSVGPMRASAKGN